MKYFLEQCLHSVLGAVKNIDAEIIVVDNHSTDGSREFFQNRFSQINFIWSEANDGFAKANNKALKIARGQYILFLNPDTLVPEDCFEKCIDFIHSKNDRCAIGVKMIDGSGHFLKESKRAFPGPLTSLYKLSGLTRLFPTSKIFARYYLGHLDENENHEVDVLAGAFMMVPAKILEKVCGFDESFFMYGEDVDLSYRMQRSGFANFYFAETSIIHFKGESTRKGSLNYVKMFYNAMSIFVRKHYGTSKAGIYNFFIQAGILLRAAMSAFSRFLKWIGLPVLDALFILLSFWIVKELWMAIIGSNTDFSTETILVAFPIFTLLFLITSYYSGLYDNGYRQSRLNKSTLISTLVIFTVYALLPERPYFSRGILLFSIILAFLLMTLLRITLSSLKIILQKRSMKGANIAIIGSIPEFDQAAGILQASGNGEDILGRIAVGPSEVNVLGTWEEMDKIVKSSVIKTLIYCQGALSFKNIISSVKKTPPHIHVNIFTDGCSSIIGSGDKETSGAYLSTQTYYRLGNPLYRRSKRLIDVSVAVFFIITFPLHFLLKKNFLRFFQNCFRVLFNRYSFIGYADGSTSLPVIKPGILTTTGLPHNKNILPHAALVQTDIIYAKHYSVFTDLGLIRDHYQMLS